MDAPQIYKMHRPQPTYRFAVASVKRVMRALGLTEVELAKRLSTSQPTIHRTINNESANRITQTVIAQYLARLARRKQIAVDANDLLRPCHLLTIGKGVTRLKAESKASAA